MKYGFVKTGAFTPKIRVADVEYNTEKIKEGIVLAEKEGVELLVFPESCVTGYTCGDLFYSDVLLAKAKSALTEIAEFLKGRDMLVFVGAPIFREGLIYNCAAAMSDGRILGIVPKKYLPNYNEFYEKRQFAPAPETNDAIHFGKETIPFGTNLIFCDENRENFTVGAELCEDLWTPFPPSISHALAGANVVVNLSCSDEVVGKAEYRRELVGNHSAKISCGYVYADAGEGESTTDMVFSGHNLIAENGRILKESELFSSGLTATELDVDFIANERKKTFNQKFRTDGDYVKVYFSVKGQKGTLTRSYEKTPFVPLGENELKSRAELIIRIQAEGLKKRAEHTRAKSLVIGLSGGLDSTLALIVAIEAVSLAGDDLKKIIAVTMPCFGTTSRTYDNTIKLARATGVTLRKVDISKSVVRHLKDLKHKDGDYDVTYENAQARERTQVLMDIANMTGGMVVGTGDLSELALGWATYNGDHMSMYAVNASVPKTLVRHLVKSFADKSKKSLKTVLYDVLDTPVSPELLPADNGNISQKTEDIVGPYVLHDFFLYNFIRRGFSPSKIYEIAKATFGGDFSNETILKWLKIFFRRFFNQQFKRSCLPDGVKVGSVTLSPRGDWRMPSDAVSSLWLNEIESLS